MPRADAEQLALAAKLIRERANKRKVKKRGDSAWMIAVATWLEFEAESAAADTQQDPATEYALAVASAYLGQTTDTTPGS